MSAQNAYDRLMPEILGINKNKIQIPNQPAEEKVVEGKKLSKIIVEDRDVLLESGLNPVYLDSFDDRLIVYEVSEAKYIVLKDSDENEEERVKILREKVFNIRKELLHNLSFVLKDDGDAKAALERIADGRTINNKIFDILPLIELAKAHLEELDRVNFDRSILDDAELLYNETQDATSNITVTPKEVTDVRDIRNRVYTYLNEAFQKIKEHGQFVFWKNEERLQLYKSEYLSSRRHSKSSKNKSDIELEPMAVEE